jgi:protein TonB
MDIAVVPEPRKRGDRHEKEGTFHNVEQMPTFPGGEAALMKWIDSHIQYPTMAQENNIQGSVVVQFVVTKTGQVGEVKVVRSVDKDLDKEAIRVCKTLPKFTPGRQNGKIVPVWYTLPVIFQLPEK